MTAAKAMWQVTAGVLPGTTEDEYTRAWGYTSRDYEADKLITAENARIIINAENEKELSEVTDTKFMLLRDEAYNYAKEITDPNVVNWVKVDFIWY